MVNSFDVCRLDFVLQLSTGFGGSKENSELNMMRRFSPSSNLR